MHHIECRSALSQTCEQLGLASGMTLIRSTNRLSHRQMLVIEEVFQTQTFEPDFARYNHPFVRAILAASTRFAAPSLLIASDR